MRRLGALLAALLGLSLLGPPAGPASATDVPALTWRSCDGALGVRCGSLTVPLDRAAPQKGSITVGLSRLKHDREPFLGTMVVDVGGPGGNGAAALRYDLDPRDLGGAARQYDWIGLDPRGVGSSRPRFSCNVKYLKTDRPSYDPAHGTEQAWLTRAAKYAASCVDTTTKRRLAKNMTTADTVADLEDLRIALGEDTLNLYGFSYGTYVGQAYATTHPQQVGRFVLDGVVDPDRVWYDANLDQDVAFQGAIDRFFSWLAARSATYRLGTTRTEVQTTYERLLEKLRKKPYRGELGPSELSDLVVSAGYSVGGWEDLGTELRQLAVKGDGSSLLNAYRYGSTGAGAEAAYAAYLATECTDAPWPGWEPARADATAIAVDHPFLTWNNTWYNQPCIGWKVPAGPRPVVTGASVSAGILLISETGDAATPFAGAVHVRELFPSSRLVAGVGGTSHAVSLSASSCVTDRVRAYLATGALPTRDDDPDAEYDVACSPLSPASKAPSSLRLRLPGR